MTAPTNAYKRHHYHLQSLLDQWLGSGERKLHVFDVPRRRNCRKQPRNTCMEEDLYTPENLSPAARGFLATRDDRAALRSRGDGTTLVERAAEVGQAALSISQRRRINEADAFGELDSKAAQAFAVARDPDAEPTAAQRHAVWAHIMALHRRTPWGWRRSPPLVERLLAEMASTHGLEAQGHAWEEAREPYLEYLRATLPAQAQLQRLRTPTPARWTLRRLRVGYHGPHFILGDNAGEPWSMVADVDGRPVLRCAQDRPLKIVYPISPLVALELTGEPADDFETVWSDTVLLDHEVQYINLAMALGAVHELVLSPSQDQRRLFPPNAQLRSLTLRSDQPATPTD